MNQQAGHIVRGKQRGANTCDQTGSMCQQQSIQVLACVVLRLVALLCLLAHSRVTATYMAMNTCFYRMG